MTVHAVHDHLFSRAAQEYLRKRGKVRNFSVIPEPESAFRQAVVIPALAESQDLSRTLDSLAANPVNLLAQTLVVVVINNRPVATAPPDQAAGRQEEADDNRRTLDWLAEYRQQTRLRLTWIDAASPRLELPEKGGVGLARKIGCDSVLSWLAGQLELKPDFVFFSLDADTLVRPDYLETGTAGLRRSGMAGATLEFRHQPAATASLQTAIDDYERFLRYYVNGLREAGSPYAFQTIGSCLAFTAVGYVRAGGFPASRQAGEDFYFCQELVKNGGLCELRNTMVFPSSRLSLRVPFGTGPRLIETINSESPMQAYDPRVFTALKEWLDAMANGPERTAAEILNALTVPETVEFLTARHFPAVWPRFQEQFKTPTAIVAAGHCWFDGFVTLKLIHHLTARRWPRIPLPKALVFANSAITLLP